jgi:hypothetical protein
MEIYLQCPIFRNEMAAGPEADHCYPVLRIRMNGDLPPVVPYFVMKWRLALKLTTVIQS